MLWVNNCVLSRNQRVKLGVTLRIAVVFLKYTASMLSHSHEQVPLDHLASIIHWADAEIVWSEGWLSPAVAKDLYETFTKTIIWKQEPIMMFGKRVEQPRLVAWYGDPGARYKYSGLTVEPQVWTKELLQLKTQVEAASACVFNSVLLNWYRDGRDSMGWHSDDERELGPHPTIASVSLGTERRFLLRRKNDHACKHEFLLKNGSLIIMRGATQHFWQHQVPKSLGVSHGRINLTFRAIKHP